tara:strand:+ start:1178 stop:1606 length:429 start_codon:yes stop_codon:yes gene_type:complete
MKIFIILTTIFLSSVSYAANVTVEMLNKLDKETMVFSPKIIKINTGDTVIWKSTDPGHNVSFMMKGGVPEGVDKFTSKIGKDTEYTFSVPGIYAYICVPHKSMGMIGFVIVGDDLSNLDSIKSVKYIGKSKKVALKLIPQLN